MGTRGLWGFVVGGETKVTYNHFDSYPEGLGEDLVKAIGNYDPASLIAQARELRVVDPDNKPTEEQIEALKKYADLNVSNQTLDDWYCLLRDTQGDLLATLDSGYMLDGSGMDALYRYVIDLDTGQLVVSRRSYTDGWGVWATLDLVHLADEWAAFLKHAEQEEEDA